jgi:type 1 glutamine amidotransferase
MDKRALIVWGGWDGHEPQAVAELFRDLLEAEGFQVAMETSLDAFKDRDRLLNLDLIVPVWTMGAISPDQLNPLIEAVTGGVGLAGCHGGMCDAFREATDYQFMTGGQWVAHPGNDGVTYRVRITAKHYITDGIPDFDVTSEQYYLHVDPSNRVLAVTQFPVADGPHAPNGPFDMPVVWTRLHGQGRVFYTSLGHQADVLRGPEAREICRRGLLWAARAVPDA